MPITCQLRSKPSRGAVWRRCIHFTFCLRGACGGAQCGCVQAGRAWIRPPPRRGGAFAAKRQQGLVQNTRFVQFAGIAATAAAICRIHRQYSERRTAVVAVSAAGRMPARVRPATGAGGAGRPRRAVLRSPDQRSRSGHNRSLFVRAAMRHGRAQALCYSRRPRNFPCAAIVSAQQPAYGLPCPTPTN